MTEKEMQEAEAICAAMAVPGLSGSDYAIAEARFSLCAHTGWPAALAEVRRVQAKVRELQAAGAAAVPTEEGEDRHHSGITTPGEN